MGAEVIKMKRQLLAMLVALVVVLAFTGVASAGTQQVLVQDAWDEQVLVSEAYDEEVTLEEAYNETVFDHYLVDGQYYVHHPAVYETIHHEAVYETIEVVDQEAYDEVVVDVPAYNESVEESHYVLSYRGVDYDAYTNAADQILKVPYKSGSKIKYENWNAQWFYEGYEAYGFRVVDDVGWGCNHIWQAIFNIIEHPEQSHIVHHDAITHEEQVLVQDAYDEQVLVTPESTEAVDYTGNGPYFGVFPDWNDIDAWADWIYSHPGSTGGWGSWIPYYELVFHPAVIEIVHYDAVYELIHHAAVYMDIFVPDPTEDVPEDGTLLNIDGKEFVSAGDMGELPEHFSSA